MPNRTWLPLSFFFNITLLSGVALLSLTLWLRVARTEESSAYRIVYRDIISRNASTRETRLVTMLPDGSQKQLRHIFLEDNVGTSYHLQWTPDHTGLLYAKKWQGDVSIYHLDLGTRIETLFAAHADAPIFSPNGRYLAYEVDGAIQVIDYQTGTHLLNTEELIDEPHHLPTWSPDSRKLLVNLENDHQLYQINLAERTVEKFTLQYDSVDEYIFTGLAWSPDAEWLAILMQFSRFPAGQLIFWQPNYERISLFENQAFNDMRLSWSPDGRWVTYPTDRLIVADEVATRQTHELPVGTQAKSGAVWSPDGRWLYYVRERNQNLQIYRRSADFNTTERLTFLPNTHVYPTLSPLIDKPWHSLQLLLMSALGLITLGGVFFHRTKSI